MLQLLVVKAAQGEQLVAYIVVVEGLVEFSSSLNLALTSLCSYARF